MRKVLFLSCALGVVAAAAGCSSHDAPVSVGAKNGAITAYQANIGTLNTAGFNLGDVVALDPETHKAFKVASVQVGQTDTEVGQPVALSSERFNSDFDLWFSENVAGNLKEEVGQAVRDHTAIKVENAFTRQLKDASAFAAGSDQLAKAMADVYARTPNARVFLVSAVVSAENVYLTCTDRPESQMNFGHYQFAVEYAQNPQLKKMAEARPAFFRATPVSFDQQNGHSIVKADKTFSEKLADYQVSEGVASSW